MSHLTRAAAATLATCVLFSGSAAADVSLGEKDGWSAFLTGRLQTFGNFNDGQGRPVNVTDGNGQPVELRGGGIDRGSALPEYPVGTNQQTTLDPGHVQEMRMRTGFTGNVLGFGIRRRISETTEILGFSAVTVGIDSDERRKFSIVRPDWRESFLRISAPWGSLTAGRMLTMFSRGATEISFLYGYRYGLGFPGGVTPAGQSTAGTVGFGVLANGFGAGMAYATPVLAGLQVTVAAFDANNIVGTQLLERTRWPRPESEITFERKFGLGMIKLFANGAWQRLFDYNGTPRSADIYGAGYGGRIEVGPVRFGVAGHWGKGVGVTYALEPHGSLYFTDRAQMDVTQAALVKLRTVDGYYGQLQVAVLKALDVRAGAGITRVKRLPEDTSAWNPDPLMPFPTPSVGFVTIRQQMGIGGGLTYHAWDNLHITAEYFRAVFEWYLPTPAPPTAAPSQVMNSVNAGVTYDF